MNGSTRTAVALGIGYVLGRRRRLRTATMMAAAAAAGSTPVGGVLLRRGAKLLGSAGVLGTVAGKMPTEVIDVIDVVRGDLVPAGKAAVSTAAASRVDALTGTLHERAERVRNPGYAETDGASEETDELDETGEAADEEDEEADAEDEERDAEDEEPVTRVRRTGTRRRATVTRARR